MSARPRIGLSLDSEEGGGLSHYPSVVPAKIRKKIEASLVLTNFALANSPDHPGHIAAGVDVGVSRSEKEAPAEKIVSEQDGVLVSIEGVESRFSPACGRSVDNVVVYESRHVQELDGCGEVKGGAS